MRCSKNFMLKEFIVSAEYPEMAALIKFTRAEAERTRQLVLYLLQPLRDFLSSSITIISGKRSPELNAMPKVKGHLNSDHKYNPKRKSIACDFTCDDLGKAWSWLLNHKHLFKLVILYESRNFIHISGLDDSPIRGKVVVKP